MLNEPNTSGRSFILMISSVVVVVTCLKLFSFWFISWGKSFFSLSPSFVLVVVVFTFVCLKWLISDEPNTSGKSFILIIPSVVVVVVTCLKLLSFWLKFPGNWSFGFSTSFVVVVVEVTFAGW